MGIVGTMGERSRDPPVVVAITHRSVRFAAVGAGRRIAGQDSRIAVAWSWSTPYSVFPCVRSPNIRRLSEIDQASYGIVGNPGRRPAPVADHDPFRTA